MIGRSVARPSRAATLFEELERDALQPLPTTRYEFAAVEAGQSQHRLSRGVRHALLLGAVPSWSREAVEVRATANVVEIFHRGRRVASHVREYGRQRFFTEPEHMPAAHRAHLEWTPSKLVAWGAQRSDHRWPS